MLAIKIYCHVWVSCDNPSTQFLSQFSYFSNFCKQNIFSGLFSIVFKKRSKFNFMHFPTKRKIRFVTSGKLDYLLGILLEFQHAPALISISFFRNLLWICLHSTVLSILAFKTVDWLWSKGGLATFYQYCNAMLSLLLGKWSLMRLVLSCFSQNLPRKLE